MRRVAQDMNKKKKPESDDDDDDDSDEEEKPPYQGDDDDDDDDDDDLSFDIMGHVKEVSKQCFPLDMANEGRQCQWLAMNGTLS